MVRAEDKLRVKEVSHLLISNEASKITLNNVENFYFDQLTKKLSFFVTTLVYVMVSSSIFDTFRRLKLITI
jgi:hypothetical protein